MRASGACRLLRRNLDASGPRRKDVDEILQVGDKGAELTRQILQIAKGAPTEARPGDLRPLSSGLPRALGRLLGRSYSIELDGPAAPLVACVGAGRFEQVVENLVVSCRDEMPQGGALRIELGEVTLGWPSGDRDDRDVGALDEPPEVAGAKPGRYPRRSVIDRG